MGDRRMDMPVNERYVVQNSTGQKIDLWYRPPSVHLFAIGNGKAAAAGGWKNEGNYMGVIGSIAIVNVIQFKRNWGIIVWLSFYYAVIFRIIHFVLMQK